MNNNPDQLPKANILVVDDTPDNLRLLSAMLTQLGHEVRRVLNGQTAAFAVGGVDYITKPFSEEEVFARVENNLTVRRLQKQLSEQNTRLQQESRDRKIAESALRLSHFYLNRSRDAVFFNDEDARFVYANEAACRILGYSREQLLTMSVYEIDLNFSAATWQSHWQALRQRDSFTFESTHRTKEGRDISVEITVNYLEFNDQEYNCAIVRDITARKHAEAALTRSEAKFRNLFENSLVGIFRSRIEDGLILEANQRFIQMMGYSCAADVINQKSAVDFYINLDERQRMLAEVQAKGEVNNFETQVCQRDGSAIWVMFSARMNVEEDCLEGVMIDISDRQG